MLLRSLTFALGLFAAMSTAFVLAPLATAATATVAPETITLGSQGSAVEVHVLIGNPTAETLRSVKVVPAASGSGRFAVKRVSGRSTIGAGDTVEHVLDVRAAAPILRDTTLALLVRYETGRRGHVRLGIATTTLKVVAFPVRTAGDIATVELKASLGTLTSGHPVPAYLLVTNKTGGTLQVGGVVPTSPTFLTVTGGEHPRTIGPGGSTQIDLEVEARSSVRPGKHELLLRVPLTTEGEAQAVDAIAAQEVEVGVEGESAILTALGVPALFLVPGFLALTAALLLWRLRIFRLPSDGGTFFVEAKSVEFWLLAISGSLLLLLFWKALDIDLFGVYSRRDVLVVWGWSIAIGSGAYIAIMWPMHNHRKSRAYTSGDDPIEVLRRMGRSGVSIVRPTFKPPGTSDTRFLLQPPDPGRASTWLAPPILLSVLTPSEELESAILVLLDDTHDPAALADVLAAAMEKKGVTVEWDGPAGLQLVANATVDPIGPQARIVRRND